MSPISGSAYNWNLSFTFFLANEDKCLVLYSFSKILFFIDKLRAYFEANSIDWGLEGEEKTNT